MLIIKIGIFYIRGTLYYYLLLVSSFMSRRHIYALYDNLPSIGNMKRKCVPSANAYFLCVRIERLREKRKRDNENFTIACIKFIFMTSILFTHEEYPSYTHAHTCIYIYSHVYVCVCVCVCIANMFHVNKANKSTCRLYIAKLCTIM